MAEIAACNELIADTVERLRALTQRSHQLTWHVSEVDDAAEAVLETAMPWQQWPIAIPNERDHIAWPRGQRSLWLCQQICVPDTLGEFPIQNLALHLSLTWWAETVAVYVNGQLIQEGDLFDYFARLKLSDRVTPGDTFTVAIYLLSPGHDDGALVRSVAMYESTDPAMPEPGFVADELTVLQTYAGQLAPEKLKEIAAAIAPLDWDKVAHQPDFLQELAQLRIRLNALSGWIKQRQITCVGHAHLDLAWLWPVEDTWQAAERTFRSVLSLQQDFPEMTYTHSSPALFEWLEQHRPELFQAIVAAVNTGSWSIDAGLWVEPELNTLGGESLARQILYGQRYTRSRFGQVSAIAWLPDSFGFSWQLPQLLKLGGIEYFATQKLRWNEATTFPYSLFWWQGLDGTHILSLTLPPIGSDIDAPLIAQHGATWEAKTGLYEMLWLPGMGDHGGGPTRDMLERTRRWADSPFFPRLTFDTPSNHLQRIAPVMASDRDTDPTANSEKSFWPMKNGLEADSKMPHPHAPSQPLPVWNDELYLELHRGCYTVHADQKWYNRRCEDALREAELYAAIAHMLRTFAYPHMALEAAWKTVLFNQFHDILPGTAIPEVFETVNPDWQAAYDTAKTIRTAALSAVVSQLPQTEAPSADAVPIYVFNSLTWAQADLVELSLADLPADVPRWRVVDATTGENLLTQLTHISDRHETAPCQPQNLTDQPSRILFQAQVPPMGYRLYWLVADHASENTVPRTADCEPRRDFYLENELIRVAVDPVRGEVRSLVHRATQRTVVRSPANQLQAFEDSGQYWDAWDIAPNYQTSPLPAATVESITWLESGPLRQRVRVVHHIANSRLQQDYVLDQGQPYLKVATVADWQACQVVLKAAFPVSFEAAIVTAEIPFGAIERPTQPTKPHDQAKWEIPAYRWADLSDGDVGLSVLTDYKHGFDAQPNQLRLTLLKAPLWPDPRADRGRHQFTYALYPHSGGWREGKTPQQAIAFNTPLQAVVGAPKPPPQAWNRLGLAGQDSFFYLSTEALHVAALKSAEDEPDQYILRVWDLYGQGAVLKIDESTMVRTDLLEQAIAVDQPGRLQPWQIATFKTRAFINKSLRNPPPTDDSP